MSEHTETLVPVMPSSTVRQSGLLDGARQLAYAWVGLWSVASDDLGAFYQRCVARGEQLLKTKPPAARPEVAPQESDVVGNRAKSAAPRRIQPMTIMNAFGAVETYHFDLNVDQLLPTKAEFDALLERVEALSREVDALVGQREPE